MLGEPKQIRLLCMLSMTFGFFIVEVVVSRLTWSLSMLSDSFHMLSDVMALVVALVAVKFAEKTHSTKKNTFGWVRAEVMGALVNAVFLTALCFTIVLEAIERFTHPQEVQRPILLAGVGAVGLVVNLLGLCLFYRRTGGGHGHSHGNMWATTDKSHKAKNGSFDSEAIDSGGDRHGLKDARLQQEAKDEKGTEVQVSGNSESEELDQDPSSASELNMHGVFLHVLGDALGSVIVVINALIFCFVWEPCAEGDASCVNTCGQNHSPEPPPASKTCVDHLKGSKDSVLKSAGPCWVLYLDPMLCTIMVGILLYTTFPLLKESALILLQTVPKQIDMRQLKKRLLSLDGVLALHELHIWQLAGSRIIATAHIKCQNPMSYMEVAKRIKAFFHDEGIHATTIQPEFVTFSPDYRNSLCDLSCETTCAPKLCCTSADKENAASDKVAGGEAPTSAMDVIIEDPELLAAAAQVPPQSEAQATVTSEDEATL